MCSHPQAISYRPSRARKRLPVLGIPYSRWVSLLKKGGGGETARAPTPPIAKLPPAKEFPHRRGALSANAAQLLDLPYLLHRLVLLLPATPRGAGLQGQDMWWASCHRAYSRSAAGEAQREG